MTVVGEGRDRVVTQRLACNHVVEVAVGTRLFCHYDVSFGDVTGVGHEEDSWHDFEMLGSPYKARGSHGYYNAARLTCTACGMDDVARRRNDPLVVDPKTWEISRPVTAA